MEQKIEMPVASPIARKMASEGGQGIPQAAAEIMEKMKKKNELAKALEEISGHPLETYIRENAALSKLLESAKKQLEQEGVISDLLPKIRQVAIHYAEKGDLLYPHLKAKYEVAGPSNLMWTDDDEIRDELAALDRETERGQEWTERLQKVIKRMEDMIYKEENILFPMCAVYFTEEEWFGIYQDAKDYADCFEVQAHVWQAAEDAQVRKAADYEGEIVMPGGHMSVEQLTAMLNTIPMEISFVDADNINRYFNEGPKVFKRAGRAIDREVFSCQPPKIEPMGRAVISDFREGKRDRVPVWMNKGGRDMLVTYMAVRDHQGTYVGTLELVQDMEFAKEHYQDN